jgi:hypothetical protein
MNNIILETDNESAVKVNLDLWKSSKGNYFITENSARYDGCTHIVCECGGLSVKPYTKCELCRSKIKDSIYNNLEVVKWDGETPLFDYDGYTYFYSEYEIEDYCNDNHINKSEIRLLLCVPCAITKLNEDYYDDLIPENGELHKGIRDAIIEFNKSISAITDVVAWEPGKKRVVLI